MKKIISLLALIGILFTSNSVEAKNNKSHESVTAKRPTILKKTFIKNDQTYKNAYKYDENGEKIVINATAVYEIAAPEGYVLIGDKCFKLNETEEKTKGR